MCFFYLHIPSDFFQLFNRKWFSSLTLWTDAGMDLFWELFFLICQCAQRRLTSRLLFRNYGQMIDVNFLYEPTTQGIFHCLPGFTHHTRWYMFFLFMCQFDWGVKSTFVRREKKNRVVWTVTYSVCDSSAPFPSALFLCLWCSLPCVMAPDFTQWMHAACTYVDEHVMTEPFDWPRGLGLAYSLVHQAERVLASAVHLLKWRRFIANISLMAGNTRITEQSTRPASVNREDTLLPNTG